MDETPFVFEVEWYDETTDLKKTFRMHYYANNNQIQLFEKKKIFLRKTTIEDINLDDLFVGNKILILSRILLIKSYADEYTRNALIRKTEKTFAMLKPDAVKYMVESIQSIYQSGLKIHSATMVVMTESQALSFYEEHAEKPYFRTLINYATKGALLGMQLRGEDAVSKWRKLIGSVDPVQAIAEDPTSLRARFFCEEMYNGFHGSDSTEAAIREISIFFPGDHESKEYTPQSSATFNNCTCCVIKPHVLHDGLLGDLLGAIQAEGFNITGLELVRFDRKSAAKFYEVYEGVLLEFQDMVMQLQSGPSVALEISFNDNMTTTYNKTVGIVKGFSDFVGPIDPELAREIRPNTLRAKFGKTKILNAVHCTDLADDGILEVEYLFKTMKHQIP